MMRYWFKMALYIITEDNSNKNGRKQKVRDSEDVSQESLTLSNPNKMYNLQNPSLSKPITEFRM